MWYNILLTGGDTVKINIEDDRVVFYNETDEVVMAIDYSTDECVWCFYSSDVIKIDSTMDIYNCLQQLMSQQYKFSTNDSFRDYKDENLLIWHSDCYYNPDDDWSIKSVSKLNIKFEDEIFKIWCEKPLDEIIERSNKTYVIGFSPLGNGRYSKNIDTNTTLQDDIVRLVYYPLKNINTKKLLKNM